MLTMLAFLLAIPLFILPAIASSSSLPKLRAADPENCSLLIGKDELGNVRVALVQELNLHLPPGVERGKRISGDLYTPTREAAKPVEKEEVAPVAPPLVASSAMSKANAKERHAANPDVNVNHLDNQNFIDGYDGSVDSSSSSFVFSDDDGLNVNELTNNNQIGYIPDEERMSQSQSAGGSGDYSIEDIPEAAEPTTTYTVFSTETAVVHRPTITATVYNTIDG